MNSRSRIGQMKCEFMDSDHLRYLINTQFVFYYNMRILVKKVHCSHGCK